MIRKPNGMLQGENLEQFARRTAKRHFPEATPELIELMVKRSLLELVGQGHADAVCVSCRNGEQCKWDGHKPCLNIVQAVDNSFAYLESLVTRDLCYKYKPFVSNKSSEGGRK